MEFPGEGRRLGIDQGRLGGEEWISRGGMTREGLGEWRRLGESHERLGGEEWDN